MFRNNLKVAFRNLLKNKTSSFINIAGLSVGIAVVILIGLWIWSELSFNKNFKNYERIAQVHQHLTNNGEVQTQQAVPYPLAAELRRNYGSDFKYVVMAGGEGNHILTHEDKKLTKQGIYFEPEAPEMLSLTMLSGTRNGLKDVSSVLLSASVAKAYFGDVDPMNQLMTIDNRLTVKVTGIFEDLPQNSSFAGIGFIAPWDLYFNNTEWIKNAEDPWRPNAFDIYTQLADATDINAASIKIRDAKLKNVNKDLAKKKPTLFLQPMSKWHLYASFTNGINVGGRIEYVWMFGIIGLFVLLLACINFMNLSTARSEKRAREVGIRKAIGSLRIQLVYQFLSESLLIVAFSLVGSLLLAQLLLPFFNEVADKKISIPWEQPLFWLLCIGFSLITGLIAGSYPAFYLSSFQPVQVLKGVIRAGGWATAPRKVLVVLQFTVSVVLIIGTITVLRQIQFSRNRPIGYDRNGLVTLPMITDEIHKHFDAVKAELTEAKAITAIAEAAAPTTEVWSTSSGFEWKGKDPNLTVDFPRISVSYDYGKTVGWQFKAGRGFSRNFGTDSLALVLNETAIRFMGLKDPLGETITWFGQPFQVIGVVQDMIMQSPYEQVKPSVFTLTNESSGCIILKINPTVSTGDALHSIETVFKKFNPEQPFTYQFVDDEYAKKFGNEKRIGRLAGFFAILAIFISCLGLFGMASFMAEQRIKEISVRKILGASVINIWGLLSKEFVVLVFVSLLIATPVAYYFMHNWLQHYHYRTAVSWWIFIAAGSGALIITLLTVSFQAIKAAIANPVKNLRSE